MSSSTRISQAVGYVVCENRKFKIRISRMNFATMVRYWQKYPSFRYIKIFEILDYKKGTQHRLGVQIAYITLRGSKLDPLGIEETNASNSFKKRHSL